MQYGAVGAAVARFIHAEERARAFNIPFLINPVVALRSDKSNNRAEVLSSYGREAAGAVMATVERKVACCILHRAVGDSGDGGDDFDEAMCFDTASSTPMPFPNAIRTGAEGIGETTTTTTTAAAGGAAAAGGGAGRNAAGGNGNAWKRPSLECRCRQALRCAEAVALVDDALAAAARERRAAEKRSELVFESLLDIYFRGTSALAPGGHFNVDQQTRDVSQASGMEASVNSFIAGFKLRKLRERERARHTAPLSTFLAMPLLIAALVVVAVIRRDELEQPRRARAAARRLWRILVL